jgi:hypothetical protein
LFAQSFVPPPHPTAVHLLQVHVPGRPVSDSQSVALQSVLDWAHGLTTGQKIVGAVGNVLNTVIAVRMRPAGDVPVRMCT